MNTMETYVFMPNACSPNAFSPNLHLSRPGHIKYTYPDQYMYPDQYITNLTCPGKWWSGQVRNTFYACNMFLLGLSLCTARDKLHPMYWSGNMHSGNMYSGNMHSG